MVRAVWKEEALGAGGIYIISEVSGVTPMLRVTPRVGKRGRGGAQYDVKTHSDTQDFPSAPGKFSVCFEMCLLYYTRS